MNAASVVSAFATPSAHWHDRPEITGSISIALQIIYLLYSQRTLQLSEVKFPSGLRGLETWCRLIHAQRAAWIYYPFFFGVALFLYWRFEKGILTLLWTTEAFIVFGLSIILRENHFRYMALAALGGCLLRLLVYDMAQSDMALRGFVFVGMGVLMLAMNAMYNKYRSRFQ